MSLKQNPQIAVEGDTGTQAMDTGDGGTALFGKADSIKSGPASTEGTDVAAGGGQGSAPGTPAAAAGAGASSGPQTKEEGQKPASPASSSSSDLPRVASLLGYYRDLSDHVVREFTAGWDHAGFGGTLVTEWQPEGMRSRPASLVWMHDEQASVKRNDSQELASHLKSMPLLPHWTFGSERDGDDLMRALILGDVAGPQHQSEGFQPIFDLKLSLLREPLGLTVQSQSKAQEDNALALYRQAYVTSTHTTCSERADGLFRSTHLRFPVFLACASSALRSTTWRRWLRCLFRCSNKSSRPSLRRRSTSL